MEQGYGEKRYNRREGRRSDPRSAESGRGSRNSLRRTVRTRNLIPQGIKVEYKNLSLIQKYVTERGKILSRRFSGVSAKEQRLLSIAIKQARFLGLLPVGSAKRK